MNDFDELKIKTEAAARDPKPGMAFHEMYSAWTFVVEVGPNRVLCVVGGGHPSWFPECGGLRSLTREELLDVASWTLLSEFTYIVEGWTVRAEGISIHELEDRIKTTGRRAGRS